MVYCTVLYCVGVYYTRVSSLLRDGVDLLAVEEGCGDASELSM
jgi:hypothetical protein